LNSTASSVEFSPSLFASPWDDVRRIYRQVCLLRARGQLAEAAALETSDLASALSTARLTSPRNQDEASLFAAEDERVTTAATLAELLVPLLAERLRAELAPAAATTAPASAAPVATRDANRLLETPPPTASPTTPPTAPSTAPSIADFIDGMLVQQRPSARR
jgi:hypothetical protein